MTHPSTIQLCGTQALFLNFAFILLLSKDITGMNPSVQKTIQTNLSFLKVSPANGCCNSYLWFCTLLSVPEYITHQIWVFVLSSMFIFSLGCLHDGHLVCTLNYHAGLFLYYITSLWWRGTFVPVKLNISPALSSGTGAVHTVLSITILYPT